MKKLNPNKLHVEYRNGVTEKEPIIDRKYTLTHSDVTAELFLTIGLTYAYDKTNTTRDEVLAEWVHINNQYILKGLCHVGGEMGKASAKLRYNIFKRELPLALEAIRYGDSVLFENHRYLDDSQIWIYFTSVYPEYNGWEYFGTMTDYK